MATQLFLRSNSTLQNDFATGNNDAKLDGTASGWDARALSTTRGSGVAAPSSATATVAGTTLGVEVISSGIPLVWYSSPLDADVTISGSITWNIWGRESDMAANVAINGQIEVIDGATGAITLIDKTARTTEMAISASTNSVSNFAETPASGVACKRGDRLRVRIFGDDVGTMASGYTFSIAFDGPTPAANGDTYLTLTENLTFVSEPAGTTVYPTDTAGPTLGVASLLSSFTGSNEEPLSEGGNWATLNTATRGVARTSNAIARHSGGAGDSYWTVADFGPDVELYATWTAVSSFGIYMWLRLQGAGGSATHDGYRLNVWSGGSYQLSSITNGASTSVPLTAVNAGTWAAGDKVGFRAIGTRLEVWQFTGGAWSLRSYATDGTYTSAGKVGIGIIGATDVVDDIYAGSSTGTFDVDAREAWTSRGAGVQEDVTNTATGWTAPLQVTDTAGGTVVDWFTRPLTAFTLGGAVRLNARARASSGSSGISFRCEIARVAGDGTSPTVWGAVSNVAAMTLSEAAYSLLVSGDDLAISDGQRLRVRFYTDDSSSAAMVSGTWFRLFYAGTSGGASGDTYLTFTQTLTEFSAGTTVTPTTAALAIAPFAPTVTAPDPQLVTPTPASLTATAFAPTVSTPELATPTTVSLTLATFAPTVSFTDNQLLTPTTAALILAPFAPVITVPEPQLVTPTTATLTLSAFAPTVSTADHQLVTPTTAALSLAAFVPAVTATDVQLVTPTTAAIVLSTFAPTVTGTDLQLVTPTTKALTLATFAPTVTAPDPQLVTPTTAALVATKYAPIVGTTYYAAVIADGPITWWRHGEPSGTVADDEIGSANADYTNTPTLGVASLLVGDTNTSVTFSRASLEYTATGATMPAGSSSGATIEAWMRFATVTAATIYGVVRWNNNVTVTDTQLKYPVSSNAWRYFYQDAGGLKNLFSDAWTPVVGTTYHVVVTHDYSAELVNFYINGTLLSTEDVSANGVPVVHPVNSFAAVARTGSDYFDGTLDEVAIYNGVLSATRILVHYNAGSGAAGPQLVTPTTLALTLSAFPPTVTAPDPQLVTPTTKAVVLATFAPTVTATDAQLVTPTTKALSLSTFAPVVATPETVTPTTNALVTATFAPTIALTDHQLVTPTTKSVVLATFAPTVTAPDHQTVTPGNATVTLATFAPTVTAFQHQTVTPITATLTTASFVPAVSVSDLQLVTPTTKALTLTANAPVVLTPILAIPTTTALVLTKNAPTVTTPETVTPTTKALSLSTFAPTVTNPQTYVPDTAVLVTTKYAPIVDVTAASTIVVPNATLTITENAPEVSATAHLAVTPPAATLTVTKHAPTVTATAHEVVTPTVKSLIATTFAPTVSTSDQQAVVPTTKALTLTTFAPTVSFTAHVAVIPDTKVLQLTAFAPQARVANYAIPTTAGLTLSAFAPFVESTQNAYIEIVPNTLTITEYPPTLAITGHADLVPITAELHLTLFPPTAEQHSITPLPTPIYGFAIVATGPGAGVAGQNGGATVRSEGGGTAVSSSGPSARVTIR